MTILADSPKANDIEFVDKQIAAEQSSSELENENRRTRRHKTLRPITWRLHFLGGFLAAPVVLMLCVSGILFAWHPQLDSLRFGDTINASSEAGGVPLQDQAQSAQAEYPDWAIYSVTPGSDGQNTKITMDPPGGEPGFGGPSDAEHAYVNQASGAVTGVVAEAETSSTVFREMHSSLWLGEDVEPLTEMAGSWFLASLLTGIYLWWPGLKRRGTIAFAKRSNLRGRRRDKEWHNAIGVLLFVPMLLLAITGLVWTQFSGDRLEQAKEQLAVPQSGTDPALAAPVVNNTSLAGLDITYAAAKEANMVEPVEILVPTDNATGWQANSTDSTFPLERDQMTVNPSTGDVTSYFDYNDEHWFNKLSTAGIFFHQAQLFGWPLQVAMTALTVSIGALVIFGYRMWWSRRPLDGLGAPPPVRQWLRSAPVPFLIGLVVIGWLMPTLGLSLAVWLVIEQGWRWWRNEPSSQIVATAKATVLGAVGVAMLVAPTLEDPESESGTISRLTMWAWSRPLGVLFLGVGLIGARTLFRYRNTSGDNKPRETVSTGADRPLN